MTTTEDIDHENTEEIVCPHCGRVERDSWEAGEGGEMDCAACNETFHFEREVSVTYTTSKISL